jgi:hypothetical protein
VALARELEVVMVGVWERRMLPPEWVEVTEILIAICFVWWCGEWGLLERERGNVGIIF